MNLWYNGSEENRSLEKTGETKQGKKEEIAIQSNSDNSAVGNDFQFI